MPAAEAFERLRIVGDAIGEKLEGYKATEFRVLGFVDDTHATATQLFDDAVTRDCLADHMPQNLEVIYVHRGIESTTGRVPKLTVAAGSASRTIRPNSESDAPRSMQAKAHS